MNRHDQEGLQIAARIWVFLCHLMGSTRRCEDVSWNEFLIPVDAIMAVAERLLKGERISRYFRLFRGLRLCKPQQQQLGLSQDSIHPKILDVWDFGFDSHAVSHVS